MASKINFFSYPINLSFSCTELKIGIKFFSILKKTQHISTGDTFTLKQINHFTILSPPFLTNFLKKRIYKQKSNKYKGDKIYV